MAKDESACTMMPRQTVQCLLRKTFFLLTEVTTSGNKHILHILEEYTGKVEAVLASRKQIKKREDHTDYW